MIGHTAAWKVKTLERDLFRSLRAFVGSSRCLDAAISRHQLKIAIRKTNTAHDASLRLVRRDVVDASGVHTDVLPIVAGVDKHYTLEQNLFSGPQTRLFSALAAAYRREKETIHSTVVADVVKHYVRGRLTAFPIRVLGGVYFVSAQREDELFALRTFLAGHGIGEITHFRIMGDGDEIKTLTEEIRHLIATREEALRETINKADLSTAKTRQRMAEKIKSLRADLEEMKLLFSFAGEEIERREDAASELLRETLRRGAPPPLTAVAA